MPQNARPKKAGRPRSEAAERAILQAAFELLQEVGLNRMTIEAVAARAGVGRPTIYRRWRNKEAMAVAAVLAHIPPVQKPTVNDPITALHQIVPAGMKEITDPAIRRISLEIIAACADNPELAQVYLHERRAVALDLVRRAIEIGYLRSDADPELILDKITGPILYRYYIIGAPPMPEHEIHNLIDEVCNQARPRSDTPRPADSSADRQEMSHER